MNEEKIISIMKMSKTGNSVRVEFDDGDSIYFPVDLVLKYKFKKDMSISEELLILMTNEKKIIEAKRYAYYIVSTRLHSKFEIKQKLKLKGYEGEQIDKALDFLESQNLLNDYKFAESYAIACFKKKGYIADRIFLELKKKGIDADIAKNVCKFFNEENEIEEKLKLLIERKLRLKQNKSPEKQKAFIIRSLSDLGYDYNIISKTLKDYF
jgi:regulatory protein